MRPTILRLRSAPGWIRVLLVLQALCAASYAVLLADGDALLGIDLSPHSWWPLGVLSLGAAVTCAARAASGPDERLAWALLATGCAGWAFGFLSWAALYEGDPTPPYPSIADAGWLGFMSLMLASLGLLFRSERVRVGPHLWLDALIPACAVSAISSQLLLPQVSTSGRDLTDQLTLLAYPAMDVLLIAVAMLVLALRRWEPGPRWGLLAIAVLGSALGDLLWTYLVAAGRHEVGGAADLPYLLTCVAVPYAAWASRGRAMSRDDDRLTLALPAVSAVGALSLLFYGAITDDLILPSLVLALAAVAAGVVRWSLASRREAQAEVLREVAAELSRKADQQAAVADLGRRAIATPDVEQLMKRASEVVATILGASRVAVLELSPCREQLMLRADSPGDAGSIDAEAIGLAALAVGTPTVLMSGALCARIERKDGSWGVMAVLSSSARSFGDDDVSFVQAVANVLGAVVAREREEQLEAQLQQSRRLESVGQLAGGVAHDFNNLLAVILNCADFAREAATDGEQRQDLEELSKAASRGAELVKQLLLFSRRKPLDAVSLDLNEVVRETEPMLRRTIGEHIELRCMLAPALPATVIDPGQLAQVLVNLAVNARDAMAGGGTITIETMPVDGGLRLLVDDTGAGMTDEVLAKAFDPFFTTKPPGSGTGLGLATVYGIVTQAEGRVAIESAPGRGTRVAIDLPGSTAGAAPRPAVEAPAPDDGQGQTILLVEDNDQVRGVARRILSRSGYRVLEASGGAHALAHVAREPKPIDLLLSDVVMPGMSGVELAEHLRRLQPGVRILHMSGYTSGIGEPDPRGRLAELIEKPFSASELLVRVQALLAEPEVSAPAA